MSIQIGYLDDSGHPRVKIRVSGTSSNFTDVDALIDTGFTGFLMLPVALAMPLGLILSGTGDYVLANGEPVTNFLALGSVTIPSPSLNLQVKSIATPTTPATLHEPETVEGIILLAGEDTLIGMEFLRSLDKLLVVGKMVALVDHSALPTIPILGARPPGGPV